MSDSSKKSERNIWRKPAKGVLILSGQPTIVFVTVRTHDRQPWLASKSHFDALDRLWRTEANHWRVGLFVLMPDHLHFLAAMTDEMYTLDNWMRFWKRRFGQAQRLGAQALQERHWDTRIRSLDHFLERSEYIRENPVTAGLVVEAMDWPYTGVVHELSWSNC